MKGSTGFVTAISVGILATAVGCGGRESMASKSAAAYGEAVRKGEPVGGGHGGHKGSEATTDSTMAGMDHSQMKGMDQGQMKGMDHSQMKGMDHSQTKGMDHPQMKGMDHSQMKGMDHSQMRGMAGMQHGGGTIPKGGLWGSQPGSLLSPASEKTMDHASMPGMDHGAAKSATAASPERGVAADSRNARSPRGAAATLKSDALDATAPIALEEAGKSSGAAAHDMSSMGSTSDPAPSGATARPSPAPADPHAGHTNNDQPKKPKN